MQYASLRQHPRVFVPFRPEWVYTILISVNDHPWIDTPGPEYSLSSYVDRGDFRVTGIGSDLLRYLSDNEVNYQDGDIQFIWSTPVWEAL